MERTVLKKNRKDKGMTQQAVADYLGISQRQYQRIEAGESDGTFKMWDTLEDLFSIHQRQLRSQKHPCEN